MELEIKATPLPEKALSFNYDELKSEILEKADFYAALVYGEEEIKQAKADRAKLNNLKKQLNDERIRREKEYMIPFEDFKGKINEIIKIIDKPVQVIDKQIKAVEEQRKAEKQKEILEEFEQIAWPEGIRAEQIIDPKWLNASVSMANIKKAMAAKFADIIDELKTIDSLEKYAFDAHAEYIKTLSISASLSKARELECRDIAKAEKALREQKNAEETKVESVPVEPEAENLEPVEPRKWIAFECLLSMEEAKWLGQMLREKGIKYRGVCR